MRKHALRRTLVALGLTLSLVGLSASPASALNYHGRTRVIHSEGSTDWGDGSGQLYSDNASPYPYAYVSSGIYKEGPGNSTEENVCIETWVDQRGLGDHRAPDVFVNCRGRGGAALYFPELQMHMPYGVGGAYGSGPGYDILHGSNTGTYDVTSKPEVMVCKVSVDGSNRFKRINPESPGSNCTRSPGSNLSVNPYNERDGWIGEVSFGDTLQYMQNLNEPEHIRADGIATLYEGQELGRGDLLVSVDGRYSARLQYDGNFVVRDNAAGTVLWAATSCGLALGGYLYHKLVMQSDGNLVLYSSDNYSSWIPRWASANMNTCGGGSFGTGSAKRLELQTDGNLIVYMGSSVLWDRL